MKQRTSVQNVWIGLLGLWILRCCLIHCPAQDTNTPPPFTAYQNNFDAGPNSLSGFTIFGEFAGPVQVVNGQLELNAPWGSSRVGVSFDTSSLVGYSNTLSGNSETVQWAFNVANENGFFNNSFFFVPATDGAEPYASGRGYALQGGGLVGNRMYLVRFDQTLDGAGTILIDVPDALGLGTLPEKGSVRITFQPSNGTWSLYMDQGLAYTDPRTAAKLLGSAVDDTYTHAPLPYMCLGGETSGTEYFGSVSITIGTGVGFPQTNLAPQNIVFDLPTEVVITNSPLTLTATASSGAPVSFAVLSGPATLDGNQLVLTGPGQVTVQAQQGGTSQYQAAAVSQTFTVTDPIGGPVAVVRGPILNPANQHLYYLLEPQSWSDSEATALTMGGHLVTINDPQEQQWVASTFLGFSGVARALWIGLSDTPPGSQHFTWASGQPVTFFCWSADPTITSQGVGRIKWVSLPNANCAWAEEGDSVALNSVVEVPLPLEIVTQPQNLSIGIGLAATLSVVADGTSAVSYQWQFMGTNLPGATDATLVLTNAQPFQSGPYNVIVRNSQGALVSDTALLAVQGLVGWGNPHAGILDFPITATNIVAISSGIAHSLARRADGSVVAWGDDSFGQTTPPADLPDVVSVAAGSWHSLALTASGTVVAWGSNFYGQTNVPSDLTSVVGIGAGTACSLAIKSDGTLVGWGQFPPIPDGLTNVVAVAAGDSFVLALKADGTLATWGDYGQPTLRAYVPEGLTNVVAIAAAAGHCLALKSDGTVASWGSGMFGESVAPSGLSNVVAVSAGDNASLVLKADGTVVAWGLTNLVIPQPADLHAVVAIAAGGNFSLALLRDGAPHFTVQPWDQSVTNGSAVRFFGKAIGYQSISYQWQFNGANINGATNDTYAIGDALSSDAGLYSLTLSNQVGLVTSRPARLVVLASSSSANQPPSLPGLLDVTLYGQTPLTVTNTATDPDLPGQVLTYQLIAAPTGATIDSNGIIQWTPGPDQVPSTNLFTTVVTDNGANPLSAINSFTVVVLNPTNQTGVGIIAGPISNPANGHRYYLLQPATWTNAESAATAMGGHLVTINDLAENTWLYDTFASLPGAADGFWIGLFLPDPMSGSTNPVVRKSQFVWVSGQPVTVQAWAETNLIRSGYCKLLGPANPQPSDRGRWAEELSSNSLCAVIELPAPLEIISQPQTVSTGIGADATFSVVADGTSPLSYQWLSSGTNLPGATKPTLTLTNVQPSNWGSFSVIVSNLSGSLTSNPAFFSVAGLVGWGDAPGLASRTNIPPGLTSILAIAAGERHDLALKPDGTVVAWGDNSYNQLSVPADLTNAVAIAGGLYHSLALKADGTVVVWGYSSGFATWVPAGLSDVVAIDANGFQNLALKRDGTVVAWGGDGALPSVVPPGLSNVVAISAGDGQDLAIKSDGTVVEWGDTSGQYLPVPESATNVVAVSGGTGASLALKADGTVIGWGENWYNQLDIPPGLSNVVGISIRALHALALKADGSVVAWGNNYGGESTVPAGLPNVVAVVGGYNHSLALLRDGAPNFTVQPWDQSVPAGASPLFAAKATGVQSMTYQWQFEGTNIAGATRDTYAIPNAQPSDAGTYDVSISNEVGKVVSRHAKLLVSAAAPPTNTNQPPVLPFQSDRIIDELSSLVVVNTATDPTAPPSALVYQLLNPPSGATIDATGVIQWTPTDAQAPGSVLITTVVTDHGRPSLSATNSFTVVVNQINTPPTLPFQASRIVSALSDLVVNNAAVNPVPASGLSYQLVNPPAGALIDSAGIIRWTPTRAQGPSTNTLTTVVSLSSIPRLSSLNSFTVIVAAPVLQAPPNYVVNAGQTVNFTNLASDNDPARKLAFSLAVAPTGASLTPDTGIFNWRPPVAVAGTTNPVLLRVTDDSPVPLSDSQFFTVTVNPLQPVLLAPIGLTNAQFLLRVSGPVGPDYILQTTVVLTNWTSLQTSSPTLMPFDVTAPTTNSTSNRLYRIQLVP